MKKPLKVLKSLFLLVCCSYSGFVHSGPIDSTGIKKLLTEGIVATNQNDFKKALPFLEEALTKSEESSYTYGLFKSYLSLGYYYSNSDPEKADSLFLLAIPYSKKLPDKTEEANIYLARGNLQWYQSNLDKAIELYLKSAELYEEHGNYYNKGSIYMNIAAAFFNDGQYEKALRYNRIAYTNNLKGGDTATIISTLLAITAIHGELQSPVDTLEYYLDKAYLLGRSFSDSLANIPIYVKLGNLAIEKNQWNKAISWAKKAYKLANSNNAFEDKVDALYVWSTGLKYQGKYAKALRYQQMIDSLSVVNNLIYNLVDNRIEMANSHFKLGHSEKAYHILSGAIELKDSLLSIEKSNQMQELEVQYETAKREKQLLEEQIKNETNSRKIKQRNQALVAAGLGILLLTMLFLLSYRTFRVKQKLKARELESLRQESELKALESLMIGEEQERERIAKELHDGISGNLAGIKMKVNNLSYDADPETLKDQLGSLFSIISKTADEVRSISHNLMPPGVSGMGLEESLRDFCRRVNEESGVDIQFAALNVPTKLPQQVSLSMYRIAQEAINNILKYADAKQALVQLSAQQSVLHLSVEDDGKGFDIFKRTEGIGLSNMKARVNALKGGFDLDSERGTGTSINIEIDLEKL